MDPFDMYLVEQNSSDSVKLLWKPRRTSPKDPNITRVQYTVIQGSKAGENSSHVQESKKFMGEGLTDCANEALLPYEFKPGFVYTIQIQKLKTSRKPEMVKGQSATPLEAGPNNSVGQTQEVTFVKCYGKDDLKAFMDKAKSHTLCSSRQYSRVNYLYRNKPLLYFDYIMAFRRGIMEVYLKDNNGHRGCPINGNINGLFFSINANPPFASFFGDTRLLIPTLHLVNDEANLYFADFYCNEHAHYVTLVLTKQRTVADGFCKQHLIQLDIKDNPFFFLKKDPLTGGSLGPFVAQLKSACHLELFYTENVNLNQTEVYSKGFLFQTVICSGSSRPGGILRNKSCAICDI